MLVFSVNAAVPAFCEQAFKTGTIRISGTGGALGAMKLLAAEFERNHPGTRISVLPSLGSSGGIKALLAGAIEIAVSGRDLTGAEQPAVAREYARTPFVFAVAKNNPIRGLSINHLVDIYAGKTRTWPDRTQIRLILRPPSEYDMTLLKNISAEMERAVRSALSRQGMIVEVTDQDSAGAIEKVPGALGTITLGQVLSEKRLLKTLPVNGVTPSAKTLADGSYPYFKAYYLITKPGAPSAVRKFLDFVYSAAGREILTRSGYVMSTPYHAVQR